MGDTPPLSRERFIPSRFPQNLKDMILSGEMCPWSSPEEITENLISQYVFVVGDKNPAHKTDGLFRAIAPGGLLAGLIAGLLYQYDQLLELDHQILEVAASHEPKHLVTVGDYVSARFCVSDCSFLGSRVKLSLAFEIGKQSPHDPEVFRVVLVGTRVISLRRSVVC